MKDAERTNRDTPAALDAIPERYWRNARFLSRTDQEKLLQAHVVIIGLGGLGGTVLEELLRLGIAFHDDQSRLFGQRNAKLAGGLLGSRRSEQEREAKRGG